MRSKLQRCWIPMPCLAPLFAVCLALLPCATARGAEPLSDGQPFEATKLLIGLRQQGLFYLQAEYRKTYPPPSDAQKSWYDREAILAQALQADTAIENRLPLLIQADAAADKAIEAEPNSPRSVLWRADRAQTWYYLAGRPLFEQVLFYGPTPSLRRALKEAADRGDQAYDQATTAVATYLDQLADVQEEAQATQARQLNISGFGLARQLQFEHAWVTLYRAFALNPTDVDRALLAGQVMRALQDQHLLQEPGEQTSAQLEAYLMAAIASRLQTDWPAALARQQAARRTAGAMPASALALVEWALFATTAEGVRLQIDQGQFQQAIASIDQQRTAIGSDPRLQPAVKLARALSLGMLNFEACSLAADAAAAEKNRAAQVAFANRRFEPLAVLANEAPDVRQSVYQLVADRLGEVASVVGLPPFAKAVFAARWIREKKFEPALAAAELLDGETAAKADFLNQDAILFKATCQQELKQTVPAAQSFVRFARTYPQDKRAAPALLSGLSLLARQEDVLDDAATRSTLIELGDLLQRSRAPEVEKYKPNWLPLVAEANLRESRYDRAAELFQMIPKDSKQYGMAMVGRILAVSGKIRFATGTQDKEKARAEAETAIQDAVQLAKSMSSGKPLDTQPQGSDVQTARLLLEAARLSIDPLGDPDRALTLLDGAQDRWQNNAQLMAQLLNVRIQALQKAGKVEQAAQLVDQFMAARPASAGPLLASLLADLQREIEQQKKSGHTEQAARYMTLALGLAQQLDKWAVAHPDALKPQQRYAIRYRLARAILQGGQAERALPLFEDLSKEDAQQSGGQTKDAGVLEGRAACLFSMGRWSDARQAYMDIWRRAQPRSEMWWQSVLHSLQCSAQLKDEDPNKILKAIRQHKDLYPDMGGPTLAKQFDELSFEMLKRIGK